MLNHQDSHNAASSHGRLIATQYEIVIRLLHSLRSGEAIVVLLGEPGTGKTLVAEQVAIALQQEREILWITNSKFEDCSALYQAILYEGNQPAPSASLQELRNMTTDFLMKQYEIKQPVLLILDEAHHLDLSLLEEIRLLTNLQCHQKSIIQILLVGLTSLRNTLSQQELSILSQRISTVDVLQTMDEKASEELIRKEIESLGCSIDDEAIQLIAEAGQGVPRKLVRLLHRAGDFAQSAGNHVIDVEAVIEAQAEWESSHPLVIESLKNLDHYNFNKSTSKSTKLWLPPAA